MLKRRTPRSPEPPDLDRPGEAPPDQAAVERAIRLIVDRLKPKETGRKLDDQKD